MYTDPELLQKSYIIYGMIVSIAAIALAFMFAVKANHYENLKDAMMQTIQENKHSRKMLNEVMHEKVKLDLQVSSKNKEMLAMNEAIIYLREKLREVNHE